MPFFASCQQRTSLLGWPAPCQVFALDAGGGRGSQQMGLLAWANLVYHPSKVLGEQGCLMDTYLGGPSQANKPAPRHQSSQAPKSGWTPVAPAGQQLWQLGARLRLRRRVWPHVRESQRALLPRGAEVRQPEVSGRDRGKHVCPAWRSAPPRQLKERLAHVGRFGTRQAFNEYIYTYI